MQQIKTWAERSQFQYEGSMQKGLTLYFGKGYAYKSSLSREHCLQLLEKFKRNEVPIGTTRTGPAEDSVGYWIEQNTGKVALACYVGAVLIHEGYAERYGSVIRFK